MNLLDTDALSHLQKNDPVGAVISTRLAASTDSDFRITVVNTFEMLGGAVDLIRELRRKHRGVVPGFKLLEELLDYLGGWHGRIMPYDDAADQVYRGFRPGFAKSWETMHGLERSQWCSTRPFGRVTWTTINGFRGSPSTRPRPARVSLERDCPHEFMEYLSRIINVA